MFRLVRASPPRRYSQFAERLYATGAAPVGSARHQWTSARVCSRGAHDNATDRPTDRPTHHDGRTCSSSSWSAPKAVFLGTNRNEPSRAEPIGGGVATTTTATTTKSSMDLIMTIHRIMSRRAHDVVLSWKEDDHYHYQNLAIAGSGAAVVILFLLLLLSHSGFQWVRRRRRRCRRICICHCRRLGCYCCCLLCMMCNDLFV